MSKKVNLNPKNSKVINDVVYVTALKVQAMSEKLKECVEYGNNIIHPVLGKMTITEAYKYLNPIAKRFGLKLNRVEDFNFARLILANRCG